MRRAAPLDEQDIDSIVLLYLRGTSLDKIGSRFHTHPHRVREIIRAHGIEIRSSGARRKYPPPSVRECAAPDCAVRFTPTPAKAASGAGVYCSKKCSLRVAREIANGHRRNGRDVACLVCEDVFHVSESRIARGRGRYCSSRCYHLACRKGPAPLARDCVGCRQEFTPRFPAFDDQRFCSHECWGRHRFEHKLHGIESLVWSPRARQRWHGRWQANKPPAPGGRPRGRPRIELDPEQIVAIRELAAKKWGRPSIAKQLGLTQAAVRKVLAG